MIERHVTFEVIPDKTQDFENLFVKAYRPAMASMPGFINVELLRLQDSSTIYQMIIRFETAEAASAWRNSPEHQGLSPQLKALYIASHLQVFEVIA